MTGEHQNHKDKDKHNYKDKDTGSHMLVWIHYDRWTPKSQRQRPKQTQLPMVMIIIVITMKVCDPDGAEQCDHSKPSHWSQSWWPQCLEPSYQVCIMLMMKIRDFEQEADLESKPLPFRDVERSDEGQYMCQVLRLYLCKWRFCVIHKKYLIWISYQINTARAKTRLGNLHVVGKNHLYYIFI